MFNKESMQEKGESAVFHEIDNTWTRNNTWNNNIHVDITVNIGLIFNSKYLSYSLLRVAEEKKESGNHLYKFKNYKGALTMYDEAIQLCPENAAYYGNRSACYMMLGMYKKALEDAQKAVSLDSTFTKGYIRMAKCCIALGKCLNSIGVQFS